MCSTGTVFDIKEFAVYDGPGVRTTVFMKGCPLRCQWCHNPEGLSPEPQLMVSVGACVRCGACRRVCLEETCVHCGQCVPACHLGLRKIVGTRWTADALAERLLRDADALRLMGGGVTFSGGEPLMQWPFVRAVIERLKGLHTCIETSAFASEAVFLDALRQLDMIIMDVKIVDPAAHRRWTGVDNAPILRNLRLLKASGKPFFIRMPVIPGVNDNDAQYEALAALLAGAPGLQRVELLPYHQTAGAKYAMVGMDYRVDFDTAREPYTRTEAFDRAGIPWTVM